MSRNKIIDAAERIFSKQGYYQTSMQDIADEAKVAKGTLYYHFKSKDELFVELLESGTGYITKELQKSFNKQVPLKSQIEDFIREAILICLKYKTLMDILFNELSNGMMDDVLERIEVIKEKYIAIFKTILEEGYQSGCVEDINLEMASISLITTLYHLCDGISKAKYTREEVEVFLLNYASQGILRT